MSQEQMLLDTALIQDHNMVSYVGLMIGRCCGVLNEGSCFFLN